MNGKNIILTGLPRSGTTLSVHLLNKLPNTVGLHEPMTFGKIYDVEDEVIRIKYISDYFFRERNTILQSGTAVTKHIGGEVPDNHIGNMRNKDSLRLLVLAIDRININKNLTNEFYLAIKHPAAFKVLLDTLYEQFPCYAIIRNALSVLGSWNSTTLPVQNGYITVDEKLDPELKGLIWEKLVIELIANYIYYPDSMKDTSIYCLDNT